MTGRLRLPGAVARLRRTPRPELVALAAAHGQDLGKLDLADHLLSLGATIPETGVIGAKVDPDDVPAEEPDRSRWLRVLLRETRGES